uniref:PiraGV ORF7 n=1 Tax=Cnaphalocrocis medinalis granulovirus TaxID=1750712 RepID=A0A0X9HZZ3_9BBAC|nr:PiraGV ORF7 [Cnaphalocrocis medinalis granulovirus]
MIKYVHNQIGCTKHAQYVIVWSLISCTVGLPLNKQFIGLLSSRPLTGLVRVKIGWVLIICNHAESQNCMCSVFETTRSLRSLMLLYQFETFCFFTEKKLRQ